MLCVVFVFIFSYPSLISSSNADFKYKVKHPEATIEIPIRIHLDQPLKRKLVTQGIRRHELRSFTKNIADEAEKLFRHPSLKQSVKLILLNTRIIKNNTDSVQMNENASKYLKSYCDWQKKKKANGKWFYSILLTGLDVYYEKSGRRVTSSTGRGYINGICSMSKSCTIIEWNPKNIAYLLTHEIAHSLGLPHDGYPNNKCKPQGFIMGSRYNNQRHPRVWSHCSRIAFKEFLLTKRARCLKPTN